MTAMTVMKFCCNKKILWTSTLFRTCPRGWRLSFINEIILYERTSTQPFQRLSGYRTGHYHPTRYNQSDSERPVRMRPYREIRYYHEQGNLSAAACEKSPCPCFAVAITFAGGKQQAHIQNWTSLGIVDIDNVRTYSEKRGYRLRSPSP